MALIISYLILLSLFSLSAITKKLKCAINDFSPYRFEKEIHGQKTSVFFHVSNLTFFYVNQINPLNFKNLKT